MERRDCLRGISLLAFMASTTPLAPALAAAGRKTPTFADNGFGEGVAVVQHPAGEYFNGKTYVSYQGPLEDPFVAAYDHATDSWEGPYQAGVSQLGKGPEYADKIDSHGKPTMLIDDAGYIHIF